MMARTHVQLKCFRRSLHEFRLILTIFALKGIVFSPLTEGKAPTIARSLRPYAQTFAVAGVRATHASRRNPFYPATAS